jgi:hypothetical protein
MHIVVQDRPLSSAEPSTSVSGKFFDVDMVRALCTVGSQSRMSPYARSLVVLSRVPLDDVWTRLLLGVMIYCLEADRAHTVSDEELAGLEILETVYPPSTGAK